jgi:hypothetical protein
MSWGRAKAGDGSRNDFFVVRDSREFNSCEEAEEYLNSSKYWVEPILVREPDEADKFQVRHPISDAAQDGRLHYR